MSEQDKKAEAAAQAEAKKKTEAEAEAKLDKKARFNSLRERAIALRDQGLLSPVAVVEYFTAGEDSDFDEIEAKLDAFNKPAAE